MTDDGLKEQWNLEDAKGGGTSAQAKQFQQDFNSIMGSLEAPLNYITSHGEEAAQQAFLAQRDEAYAAYNELAGKLANAKDDQEIPGTDKVLQSAGKLQQSVLKAKGEIETAYNAWQELRPTFDLATTQIEELEVWESEAAPGLMAQAAAITTGETARKWDEIAKDFQTLNTELTPIHADYVLQKAAQDPYLQARAGFDEDLGKANALPEPSSPMTALQEKIAGQIPDMDEKAKEKLFVAAQGLLDAALVDLTDLTEQGASPERSSYLATYPEVETGLDELKRESAEATAARAKLDQAKGAAEAGDYGSALAGLNEAENQLTQAQQKAKVTSVRIKGETTYDFSGTSFATSNVTDAPGTGCQGCSAKDCVHVTGTINITFRVTTQVTLPRVADIPDLSPCQKRLVQDAIDNVLAPHEQEHVQAVSQYNGTQAVPFNETLCRPDFNDKITEIVNGIDAARQKVARDASDALDPFYFDVDIDCED